MRTAGIYLLEAQIIALRIQPLPEADLLFTLRVGRNYTSTSHSQPTTSNLNAILQLNIDSSALQTQRCSLTVTLTAPANRKMIGIALISLPKDKNQFSNTFKLTQSEDKAAEIELKVKITPLDGSIQKQIRSQNPIKSEQIKHESKEGYSPSKLKVQSKASEGSEVDQKKGIKNYKLLQENIIQIPEKELKRYKQEKDAYYQLYQIQKTKNEAALKFISSLIKKLSSKYPNLNPSSTIQTKSIPPTSDLKKKPSSQFKTQTEVNQLAQLEQANRSLHRQVDEYKKTIEQLKQKVSNGMITPDQSPIKNKAYLALTPQYHSKSTNIIPASLKENEEQETNSKKQLKDTFAGIDLKKWLDMAIKQRTQIQTKFMVPTQAATQNPQNKGISLKKLRAGIDRSLSQLLSSKELSKAALLSFKQQLNSLFEDYPV